MVKSGYEAVAAGIIQAELELFAPDIVWHECPGYPWIEGDGVSVGADTIVQNVFAPIPAHYDGFSVEVTDLIDGGDKIVMAGYYASTHKATGKSYRANAAHI